MMAGVRLDRTLEERLKKIIEFRNFVEQHKEILPASPTMPWDSVDWMHFVSSGDISILRIIDWGSFNSEPSISIDRVIATITSLKANGLVPSDSASKFIDALKNIKEFYRRLSSIGGVSNLLTEDIDNIVSSLDGLRIKLDGKYVLYDNKELEQFVSTLNSFINDISSSDLLATLSKYASWLDEVISGGVLKKFLANAAFFDYTREIRETIASFVTYVNFLRIALYKAVSSSSTGGSFTGLVSLLDESNTAKSYSIDSFEDVQQYIESHFKDSAKVIELLDSLRLVLRCRAALKDILDKYGSKHASIFHLARLSEFQEMCACACGGWSRLDCDRYASDINIDVQLSKNLEKRNITIHTPAEYNLTIRSLLESIASHLEVDLSLLRQSLNELDNSDLYTEEQVLNVIKKWFSTKLAPFQSTEDLQDTVRVMVGFGRQLSRLLIDYVSYGELDQELLFSLEGSSLVITKRVFNEKFSFELSSVKIDKNRISLVGNVIYIPYDVDCIEVQVGNDLTLVTCAKNLPPDFGSDFVLTNTIYNQLAISGDSSTQQILEDLKKLNIDLGDLFSSDNEGVFLNRIADVLADACKAHPDVPLCKYVRVDVRALKSEVIKPLLDLFTTYKDTYALNSVVFDKAEVSVEEVLGSDLYDALPQAACDSYKCILDNLGVSPEEKEQVRRLLTALLSTQMLICDWFVDDFDYDERISVDVLERLKSALAGSACFTQATTDCELCAIAVFYFRGLASNSRNKFFTMTRKLYRKLVEDAQVYLKDGYGRQISDFHQFRNFVNESSESLSKFKSVREVAGHLKNKYQLSVRGNCPTDIQSDCSLYLSNVSILATISAGQARSRLIYTISSLVNALASAFIRNNYGIKLSIDSSRIARVADLIINKIEEAKEKGEFVDLSALDSINPSSINLTTSKELLSEVRKLDVRNFELSTLLSKIGRLKKLFSGYTTEQQQLLAFILLIVLGELAAFSEDVVILEGVATSFGKFVR